MDAARKSFNVERAAELAAELINFVSKAESAEAAIQALTGLDISSILDLQVAIVALCPAAKDQMAKLRHSDLSKDIAKVSNLSLLAGAYFASKGMKNDSH